MHSHAVEMARKAFAQVHSNEEPTGVAVAPGRVNLLGEHTDYNGGFVLPMAIDACIAVAFASRTDGKMNVLSVDFGETREFDIRSLRPPGGSAWADYVAAVTWALRDSGISLRGADLVLAGDVPVGAGLASSAAVEMATARAMCAVAEVEWSPTEIAAIAQRAENEYVGVSCGIMDQFASAVCIAGSALLLDCRSLSYSHVNVPPEASVVVMDTGVRRTLAASEYNDRRASCEEAVAVARRSNPSVLSLRDIDSNDLSELAGDLDELVLRRARHVVIENHRPVHLAAALRSGDLVEAGKLMNESHVSLRDLYEVSCDELDLITDLARENPACYGARMTGAGFGGCAVAMVNRDNEMDFVADVENRYALRAGREGKAYVCRPSQGTRLV